MRIDFEYVSYKNLMSIGNTPIRIELDRSSSTLVGGKNGSGKSAIFQAIAYCLYGKFISDIKLTEAINTINKNKLVAELQFRKAGDAYKVIRGEKPKVFEIYKNDKLIDQSANARDQQALLDIILGMDFKAFCQLVILDMDRFVPFMKMSAAERRKVIDDVLDTAIYTEMADICKVQLKEVANRETTIDRERYAVTAKRDAQSSLIKQIQNQLADAKNDVANDVKKKQDEVEEMQAQIEQLRTESTEFVFEGLDKIKKQKSDLQRMGFQFDTEIKNHTKALQFFTSNDACPTCGQLIDNELKEQKTHECQESINKVKDTVAEMLSLLQGVVEKESDLDSNKQKFEAVNRKISELSNRIKYIQSDINKLLARSTDIDDSELVKAFAVYEEYEKKITELTTSIQDVILEKELLQKVASLVADSGIKSLIVKEYIPFFNRKINEYLNAMDYFIGLKFDESFTESFTSMNKENFSYENLSKGQRCRVNLAIWLALLEISSMKNSMVTNLLCLDEILEPLDSEGIKLFMSLSNTLLHDKNLFCITQRYDEMVDYFRSAIRFKLVDEFTEIETI